MCSDNCGLTTAGTTEHQMKQGTGTGMGTGSGTGMGSDYNTTGTGTGGHHHHHGAEAAGLGEQPIACLAQIYHCCGCFIDMYMLYRHMVCWVFDIQV